MAKRGKEPQAKVILKALLPNIYADPSLMASEFASKWWSEYKRQYPTAPNSLNGKVFEELIAASLVREGIVPLYLQARVTYIPEVNYDCIIYTAERGPISISAKTSLRERWKQADLEALALKNIHRRALSYLVTMDSTEVRRRRKDPGSVLALNGFVLVCSPEYDSLLQSIKEYKFILAPKQVAVTSSTVISDETLAIYYP